MSAQLPPARRVIFSHKPTGEPDIVDEVLPSMQLTPGFTMGMGYVQRGIPADPANALEGGKVMPDTGFAQSDGLVSVVVDYEPGAKSSMHYTQSFDYFIVTNGKLTCYLHDGTKKTFVPGELVIQTGHVHQWANEESGPARCICVASPAKAREINGKSLHEALGAKENP